MFQARFYQLLGLILFSITLMLVEKGTQTDTGLFTWFWLYVSEICSLIILRIGYEEEYKVKLNRYIEEQTKEGNNE